MTDAAGVAVDIYTYDPHGNSETLTGNPFRYTGRRLDAETGLYYYRARYYSPALGRFLQTDPIGYGDGLNWYAYVGNDPVNGVDPFGLGTVCIRDDFGEQCTTTPPPTNTLSALFVNSSGGNLPDVHDRSDLQNNPPSIDLDKEMVQCPAVPSRVLLGNARTVGRLGGLGKPVPPNSAAIIPRQFTGADNAGPKLRKVGPLISGETSGGQSFNGIGDTIGSRKLGVPTALQAQNIIMARDAEKLIIELPNGIKDEGSSSVTVTGPGDYVREFGCPTGSIK